MGLGYPEVFGLVRWPQKNSHQKTAQNSCFFGDDSLWAIEPAQKLHGTLDPPAAHLFCYQYDLKKQ